MSEVITKTKEEIIKESIIVLIQASQIAQKKGVFSLGDASTIYNTINILETEFGLSNTNDIKNETT